MYSSIVTRVCVVGYFPPLIILETDYGCIIWIQTLSSALWDFRCTLDIPTDP